MLSGLSFAFREREGNRRRRTRAALSCRIAGRHDSTRFADAVLRVLHRALAATSSQSYSSKRTSIDIPLSRLRFLGGTVFNLSMNELILFSPTSLALPFLLFSRLSLSFFFLRSFLSSLAQRSRIRRNLRADVTEIQGLIGKSIVKPVYAPVSSAPDRARRISLANQYNDTSRSRVYVHLRVISFREP